MEEGPEAAQARASREASGWLILLQEEPDDPAVKRRFEDWLRASPANADAWMAMQHVADVASIMPAEFADRWQAEVAGSVRLTYRRRVSRRCGHDGQGGAGRSAARRWLLLPAWPSSPGQCSCCTSSPTT